MKKIFLTSGLVICMACPAFAIETEDILSTATSADCVAGTIGVYSGSTELEAKWNANDYTISYDKGKAGNRAATEISGTMNPQSVKYDEVKPTTSNAFSIDGYDFAGWTGTSDAAGYSSTSYANGYTFNPYQIAGDLKLTANWTAKKYDVIYTPTDHSTATQAYIHEDGATYDSAYTIKSLADTGLGTATGYSFKEWNSASDGTGTAFTGISAPWTRAAADITVYAIYTANTYTLSYNCGTASNNGQPNPPHTVEGTAPQGASYDFDEIISQISNNSGNTNNVTGDWCQQSGYTFNGWVCKSGDGTEVFTTNASGQVVKNGTVDEYTWKVDGNITCTAQWQYNTINITWTSDGKEVEKNTCDYDGDVSLPAQPEKPGYTFNGWKVKGKTEQQMSN